MQVRKCKNRALQTISDQHHMRISATNANQNVKPPNKISFLNSNADQIDEAITKSPQIQMKTPPTSVINEHPQLQQRNSRHRKKTGKQKRNQQLAIQQAQIRLNPQPISSKML